MNNRVVLALAALLLLFVGGAIGQATSAAKPTDFLPLGTAATTNAAWTFYIDLRTSKIVACHQGGSVPDCKQAPLKN